MSLDRTLSTKGQRRVKVTGRVEETVSEFVFSLEKFKKLEERANNPEKFTILKDGELEVFCYPYSNHCLVFVRVKDKITPREVTNAKKLMSKLTGRLRTAEKRMKEGMSKYDSSKSGERWDLAYSVGYKCLFDEDLSRQEALVELLKEKRV